MTETLTTDPNLRATLAGRAALLSTNDLVDAIVASTKAGAKAAPFSDESSFHFDVVQAARTELLIRTSPAVIA